MGTLSDDSSNTDVDNVITEEKNEEIRISSKKITPLYSEASWLNRTNNTPTTTNIGQKICGDILSEILQNLGTKKRQRSSSFSVVDDEKSSKLSKYGQVEIELEAMFSDNNVDAR